MTRQSKQDGRDRTARTGQQGLGQDWIARTGQPETGQLERGNRNGQAEDGIQSRTARIRLPVENGQNRTVRAAFILAMFEEVQNRIIKKILYLVERSFLNCSGTSCKNLGINKRKSTHG